VDVGSALTNALARGRRSRVVLTPRRWRQVPEKQSFLGATVAKKPGRRGELGVSRKTIARGMSDRLRCPVCSCAFFAQFARETADAARIRHSLLPRLFGGRWFVQSSDAFASRECGRLPQRHCEERSDEAIHSFFARQDGLLRFARNDGAQGQDDGLWSFRGDAKHRTRNLEIPGWC